MNQDKIMWAAGLFEGEGSVMSVENGKTLSLSLAMSDEDVVKMFADVMGRGKVHGPYQYGKSKPMWYWKVSSKDFVDEVFEVFKPYLGKRRLEKFAEVFSSWENYPGKRYPSRRNTKAK
jgi:hypoxanthine phosphoribosyltransferase